MGTSRRRSGHRKGDLVPPSAPNITQLSEDSVVLTWSVTNTTQKIGGYLSCFDYQDQSCRVIEEHIDDFLTYLDMNRSMFFTSKNYAPASVEYIAKCGGK